MYFLSKQKMYCKFAWRRNGMYLFAFDTFLYYLHIYYVHVRIKRTVTPITYHRLCNIDFFYGAIRFIIYFHHGLFGYAIHWFCFSNPQYIIYRVLIKIASANKRIEFWWILLKSYNNNNNIINDLFFVCNYKETAKHLHSTEIVVSLLQVLVQH